MTTKIQSKLVHIKQEPHQYTKLANVLTCFKYDNL